MASQAQTTSSRAVSCIPGGGTRLVERPRPVPRRGELLLRLRACGLCGTDLFKLAAGSAAPGAVLGHEVVGEVEQVGAGVEGFERGDRVAAPHHVPCGSCPLCLRGNGPLCPAFRENLLDPGGFSEHLIVRERAVRAAARRIPAEVSDEAAVFLEPAACVLRGIRRSGLPFPGNARGAVVVLGAGGMGLLHLLVLRALEPRLEVLLVDPLVERRRRAEDLGASRTATPEAARAAAAEITRGLGAEAVFDTVGGAALLDLGLDLLRPGGTVVLFAHAPEGETAQFPLNGLFKEERRVVGTYSSTPEEQEEIWKLISTGRLDASPLVTHRLPLSRFGEAVDLARARRALKVLLVPEGGAR